MKLREMIDSLQRIYCQLHRLRVHAHPEYPRAELAARAHREPPRRAGAQPRVPDRACCASCWRPRASSISCTPSTWARSAFPWKAASRSWSRSMCILEDCPQRGLKEIVMGMAHRGRLNVLTNFLANPSPRCSPSSRRTTFPNLVAGDGDVKYHLGYTTTRTDQHRARKSASAWPRIPATWRPSTPWWKAWPAPASASEGYRGAQKVLPLLMHGDAAFAGQGIVAEVLNMSQLPGLSHRRHGAHHRQ